MQHYFAFAEEKLVRLDGSDVDVEITGLPFTFQGQPAIQVVARDITERVEAEQARAKSEERFKRALENIPDVVVIYDSDLRIQYINNATQQITGRPPSYFIGKREEEIWPPEVYEAYFPALKQAAATQEICAIETELALPDNQTRSLRITCVPISDENGQLREILGITHDFTERERAQRTLRKSKERFEKVIAQSPVPMVITKPNGDIEYFNDTFTKIFGYTVNDVTTAEEWWRLAYPDEAYRRRVQQSWETAIAQAEKSGQQIAMQEWDITCKNGAVRRAEFNMTPLGDISVIAMNDITERLKAEEELRQSEKRLSVVFNHTSDAQLLWAVESNGAFRVVAVNKPYIEATNSFGLDISGDILVGKTMAELHSLFGLEPNVLDYTLKKYKQAVTTGDAVHYTESLDFKSGAYHSEITLLIVCVI